MLKTYRAKRDFSKTPEPKGHKKSSPKKSQSLSFVVQEHAATRLHFDFRLEANGVLLSWAVPKGPSLNPHEKRLAVMTEDHPLDYAGFEGIIPSGYGAGEVIVWDNGTYAPLDSDEVPAKNRDQAEKLITVGLKAGKFSFQLQGHKLQGVWTLVRLKNKEKDWLLIKHEDEFASSDGHPWQDDSILSGQTLEDLQSGQKKEKTATANKLAKTKEKTAKRKTTSRNLPRTAIKKKTLGIKLPEFKPPMLATLTTDTFVSKEWLFEPKLDGIRAIAYINGGEVTIYSRRGLLITPRYPALVKTLSTYKHNLILDGEICALDKNHHPSFEKLQERSGLTKKDDIAQAEIDNPIIYYVFDVIFCNGRDLRSIPLSERKQVLHQMVTNSKTIKVVEKMGSDGKVAFKACIANGLEGVVAKRLTSLYQSGKRSPDWLKIKSTTSAEFIICGYTKGTGARKNTFGALILGEYNKSGRLVPVCSVGTGFDEKKLHALLKVMKSLEQKESPFAQRLAGISNPTWLKPEVVAEIKYAERTKEGHLRVPVFLHLREDIDPRKVKPAPLIHTDAKLLKKVTPAPLIRTRTKTAQKNKSAAKINAKSSSKTNTKSNSKMNAKSDSRIAVKAAEKTNNTASDRVLRDLDNDYDNLELDVEGNHIILSHLNKSFWPKYQSHKTITKRDYLRYLIKVSPYLLPHLKDRMITLIRFPQGIEGIKFFQKHWQENLPDFVQTVIAYTEHEKRDQKFLLCNNLSTLIWLGQIADLELHTSHTRISNETDAKKLPKTFTGSLANIEKSLLNYPDYMVFDLDPYLYSGQENKGTEPELHRKGFRKACEVALWLKELLDELSIKAFIKTSGKTGLHVYVPIERNLDYDTVRALSQTIGHYILERHANSVTMDWSVVKRTGKVFFDHNMNARSKSLASIYSPRVSKEAAVSTPVEWNELDKIYPTDFTLETLPARLSKSGDLWTDILSSKNNLQRLLNSNFMEKAASNKKTKGKQLEK